MTGNNDNSKWSVFYNFYIFETCYSVKVSFSFLFDHWNLRFFCMIFNNFLRMYKIHIYSASRSNSLGYKDIQKCSIQSTWDSYSFTVLHTETLRDCLICSPSVSRMTYFISRLESWFVKRFRGCVAIFIVFILLSIVLDIKYLSPEGWQGGKTIRITRLTPIDFSLKIWFCLMALLYRPQPSPSI